METIGSKRSYALIWCMPNNDDDDDSEVCTKEAAQDLLSSVNKSTRPRANSPHLQLALNQSRPKSKSPHISTSPQPTRPIGVPIRPTYATNDRLCSHSHSRSDRRAAAVLRTRTYVDYERMILVVSRVTDMDRALRPRGAMWMLMLRSAVSARRSASSSIC